MKVLHVPFGYFPDAVGGTEVYVADLCQALKQAGVESAVAAPSRAGSRSEHEGVPVHRYAVSPAVMKVEIYGDGDAGVVPAFESIVAETRPDVVHLHAMSTGAGGHVLRSLKRRGMPVIYTYHTPTATCMRGTLLRWGKEHCDGVMRETLCAACYLHSRGAPRWAARGFTAVSALLGDRSLTWRAPLDVVALSRRRTMAVRRWLTEVDRVVALCDWSRRLLLANGVPESRLRTVRHGIGELPAGTAPARVRGQKPVRLVFLGRVDPVKGLDVLLGAMSLIPDVSLELDVHVVLQPDSHEALAVKLRECAARDARVRVLPPVPRTEVRSLLEQADALVVPSLWFETGPLVVLEAFAAGVPVLGSGWGGIAEWVRDGVDGLLVGTPDPRAWASALRRLAEEEGLLETLRRGVQPPRSMREVAGEMAVIYEEVCR